MSGFPHSKCVILFGMVMATSLLAAVTVPVGRVETVRDLGRRTYPGRVIPIAEVNVTPQVSGEILEVCFREGQMIEKGAPLYRIDPVKYIAAEKNAEAKVAQVKSNLGYLDIQVARYSELVKTRAVPQDDLDRALSERDAYRASLAAAEADLLAAQDDVKHCSIVAPIAGRVGSTAMTAGNFVTRGGSTLVRLVQTDPIRVGFEISSVDFDAFAGSDPERLVSIGSVALSRISGSETVATGHVEFVECAANPATDSVQVYARVANANGRLVPGQTLMAALTSSDGVIRPAVPPNAVALDARGTYVWIVGEDDIAHQRRVTRGALQDGRQLIVSGLRAGERIVTDGVHRVKDGDKVTAGE